MSGGAAFAIRDLFIMAALGAPLSMFDCTFSKGCLARGCDNSLSVKYSTRIDGAYTLNIDGFGDASSSVTVSCPAQVAAPSLNVNVYVSCDSNGFSLVPDPTSDANGHISLVCAITRPAATEAAAMSPIERISFLSASPPT